MRASSSAVRGPVVSQPERSVSATASISSSVIAGGWNDENVGPLVEESSGIGGDEAYAVGGARPPAPAASSRESPTASTAPARSAPRRSGAKT